MEKYEALWAYQTEDMKADAIANAIKRSPTRQKLEKARDFILDRQKKYRQIEEDVAAMVDRKDIIAAAGIPSASMRQRSAGLQKRRKPTTNCSAMSAWKLPTRKKPLTSSKPNTRKNQKAKRSSWTHSEPKPKR